MADFSEGAHWRDSARHTRFFMVDARAAFPLLLFLMHIRVWTFTVAIVAMFFFGLLERYGFTMRVFRHWLRELIAGRHKTAIPWWKE